jgi:selenide,water dikinase
MHKSYCNEKRGNKIFIEMKNDDLINIDGTTVSIENIPDTAIKLTQYSHGAGCGCKISPRILDEILTSNIARPDNDKLIVGNHSKDDAAVYDLGNGTALISTTDFFMPIVDDPYEFGRIASANAISDVYAMGGKPILAIAILGWPVNILPPAVAQKVIEGSRSICLEAGIPLAGGHSIDSPEPIFGLAVNGLVAIPNIKQNNLAKEGDLLFLTKPLGVGILTTAEKKGLLQPAHKGVAAKQMMQLNKVGEALGAVKGIHAMTDITGFGLLGHLVEMAEGSGVTAVIKMDNIPLITAELKAYLDQNCVPGGTHRNWDSYGEKIGPITPYQKTILADPQTSGGLLIAVSAEAVHEVKSILQQFGLEKFTTPVGNMIALQTSAVLVQS